MKTRFAVFYFLLFFPIGVSAPYLMLFFDRKGFTDPQLGTLAAVAPLMNMATPVIWGHLADRFGDRRSTLGVLLVASALVFPWLMLADDFGTALSLTMVFSAFAFAPVPIADAITFEYLPRAGGDYGRLRLWGSVGFIVPLIALGLVLQRSAGETAASLHVIFYGYTVSRLLSACWVLALPPSRGEGRGRLDWRGAGVFAGPRFAALAATGVLAVVAMSSYYVFFTIYLDELGIADNAKGYFWAIAVAAETGMMLFVGGLIGRIGLKWTLSVSLLGTVVRLFGLSLPLTTPLLVALQCLHALTFTAFTVSSITLVSRLTPPRLRASGQTMWAALTAGVGAAIGAKLAGLAADTVGLPGMFRVFSVVAAGGLAVAVLLVREPPPEASPRAEDA